MGRVRRLSEWKSFKIQEQESEGSGWGGWVANQNDHADGKEAVCPWAVNDWSFNPKTISVIAAPRGSHSFNSSTALLSHNSTSLNRLGMLTGASFNVRFLSYFFMMLSVFLAGLLLAIILS